MAITGTWKLNQPVNAWTRVFVHLPDSGSQTQQAIYTVHPGDGTTENRTLNVYATSNRWVSLGVFDFTAGNSFQGLELSNFTQDGIGVGGEDIAWDAAAFQPLPAKPTDFVVQMGDSYSSGEGAQPYLQGTDVGPYADLGSQSSPGRSWNACRRSQNSWIRQTTLPGRSTEIGQLADTDDATIDYHSTACSGAYLASIDSTGATDTTNTRIWGHIGQHHEVPQLTAGFLDANTTLVVLTAGGNDAGFSSTVQNCALLDCPSDASVKSNIDSIEGSLETLLTHIHAKAKNAKVVLLGYPELFDMTDYKVGCSVMTPPLANELNGWADYMVSDEQQAVGQVPSAGSWLNFYDVSREFGTFGVCGLNGGGINDLVSAPSTTGGGDFSCPGSVKPCPSMESYHPNNRGVQRYAVALENALQVDNY
ncbi:hypothetical protein OG455_25890 [Kitasatospora sp. NBC_01287]|uniref:golvesin C-terminal-like domain-containing protein n=1 Tax=Kitasatospora sp. NBC_01287 TaxID=2903573 RepID=UPI00225378AC|nr:hypothetical protein [Kitasatospora sp. NBC_01287]MCX4748907.1 hypothetical protein [Kitasatospora sp. NBC_01287]